MRFNYLVRKFLVYFNMGCTIEICKDCTLTITIHWGKKYVCVNNRKVHPVIIYDAREFMYKLECQVTRATDRVLLIIQAIIYSPPIGQSTREDQ